MTSSSAALPTLSLLHQNKHGLLYNLGQNQKYKESTFWKQRDRYMKAYFNGPNAQEFQDSYSKFSLIQKQNS